MKKNPRPCTRERVRAPSTASVSSRVWFPSQAVGQVPGDPGNGFPFRSEPLSGRRELPLLSSGAEEPRSPGQLALGDEQDTLSGLAFQELEPERLLGGRPCPQEVHFCGGTSPRGSVLLPGGEVAAGVSGRAWVWPWTLGPWALCWAGGLLPALRPPLQISGSGAPSVSSIHPLASLSWS